jgi:hypothetical protein
MSDKQVDVLAEMIAREFRRQQRIYWICVLAGNVVGLLLGMLLAGILL